MSEATVFPEFFTMVVPNPVRTAEVGTPQFDDREMVRIRMAGDPRTVVEKKATQVHIDRWPAQYKAFKESLEPPVDGTPIDQMATLTPARIAELKAQTILTVEALAELRDGALQGLGMGGRELQKQAKAYLKAVKSTAAATQMAKKNAQLEGEIELLRTQLAEMNDVIEGLKGKQAA